MRMQVFSFPVVVSLMLVTLSTAPASSHAEETSAPGKSGSVEGHVICNDGGFPSRGATVQLVARASLTPGDGAKNASQKTLESLTDFDGYYEFASVPPGTYIVDVRMDGYGNDLKLIRGALDRLAPDEQKILLDSLPQVTMASAGSARKDVVLHRAGAIGGHVSVDSGGTVGKTSVTATMVSTDLTSMAHVGEGKEEHNFSVRVTTDDRGVYRIAGLPRGKYRIGMRLVESYYEGVGLDSEHFSIRPTRSGVADLTVFSPEALTEKDAKLVEIGEGEERLDIDITVPTRLLHSIGGTVTQGGAPLEGAYLTIHRDGKEVMGMYGAVSTSAGNYRFDLLPRGAYTVEAKYPHSSTSVVRSASREIVVQLDDSDLIDANLDVPSQIPAK